MYISLDLIRTILNLVARSNCLLVRLSILFIVSICIVAGNSTGDRHDVSKIRVYLTRDFYHDAKATKPTPPQVNYLAALGIGTPAQTFIIKFDEQSSDIWIASETASFKSEYNRYNKNNYQPSESNTSTLTDSSAQIKYRSSRLAGKIHDDIFTLYEDLHTTEAELLVTPELSFKQNFLALEHIKIDEISSSISQLDSFDGIIGLGFGGANAGIRSFLHSLELAQKAKQKSNFPDEDESQLVIGLWLNPVSSSRFGGELMLGGLDETRYSGEIHFYKILDRMNFRWTIRLKSMTLGSLDLCPTGCHATLSLVDNFYRGPREDVQKIYNTLNAKKDEESNLWLVDCDKLDQYPEMTFEFGDTKDSLNPQTYIRKFKFKGKKFCYVAIEAQEKEAGWILGTNFLEGVYTVVDYTNFRIGFADTRDNVISHERWPPCDPCDKLVEKSNTSLSKIYV